MKSKPKSTPIEQRREQINEGLEKLKSSKSIKTRKDFKSDNLFDVWRKKYDKKLYELSEELTILDNPDEYNEIPLAVAAVELGLTLQELRDIVCEELIETSFVGEYSLGA